MSSLAIGVIGSLIAAGAIALVTWLSRRARSSRRKRAALRAHTRKFGERMWSSGVSNFYVSRSDWARYRSPPELVDYIAEAQHELLVAGYWMAQGTLEGTPAICRQLADRGVQVSVTMVDPDGPAAELLAEAVDMSVDAVRSNIRTSLRVFESHRSKLSPDRQRLFSIRTSAVVPQAAAILRDPQQEHGSVQLEFRAYRGSRNDSFAIEFRRGDSETLYNIVCEGWTRFVEDANPVHW